MTLPGHNPDARLASDQRTDRQRAGDAAERRALAYLIKQGCRPIATNTHAKVGELDLVVTDGQTLVFVEVRFRATTAFGGAAGSVGAAKQLRIRRSAELFLLRRFGQSAWPACRFDVIAIEANELNWIKNAF